MTEVELYQDRNPEQFIAETIRGGTMPRDTVDGWVGMLVQVDALANAICDTEFVPKTLRGKPAAVAACILTGRELGIGPMASLKHVQIIDGSGTPSLSAEYKRARVLEHGHKYKIVELTPLKCVIDGKRREDREWTRFEYTIADARKAKLIRPNGAYEKTPRRMLLARCSSDMCDAIFTDVTNGLATTELLEDLLGAEGSDLIAPTGTDEPKPPVRRRGRKPRAASPEPEIEEEKPAASGRREVLTGSAEDIEEQERLGAFLVEDDPEEQDELWDDPEEEDDFPEPEEATVEVGGGEPMATDAQFTRLAAQAKALRLNAEQQARAASDVTGRKVASFGELTEVEAEEIVNIFAVAQRKDKPQAALKRLIESAVRDREEEQDEDYED